MHDRQPTWGYGGADPVQHPAAAPVHGDLVQRRDRLLGGNRPGDGSGSDSGLDGPVRCRHRLRRTGAPQLDRPAAADQVDAVLRAGRPAYRLRQPHPAPLVDDEHLLRRPGFPLLAEPAVADAHHPVGYPGRGRVVGDQQQGGAGGRRRPRPARRRRAPRPPGRVRRWARRRAAGPVRGPGPRTLRHAAPHRRTACRRPGPGRTPARTGSASRPPAPGTRRRRGRAAGTAARRCPGRSTPGAAPEPGAGRRRRATGCAAAPRDGCRWSPRCPPLRRARHWRAARR